MNFDDLQKQWQEDNSGDNLQLPQSEKDMINKSKHPIAAIKKAMKKDFVYQLISLVLLGLFPLAFYIDKNLIPLFYMQYGIMLLICIAFLRKFYQFTQQLNNYSLNSYESLFEIYYELKLHIEKYKSVTYAILPFALFMLILHFYSNMIRDGKTDQILETKGLIVVFGITALVTIFVFIMTHFYLGKLYGKYVNHLKKNLDDFRNQETA